MERRTSLKGIATAEALLTTAGCIGGGSELRPTAGIETSNEIGSGTTGGATTEAGSAEVLSPGLTFRTNSGVLCIVYMGGEKITDEGTDEVYVTIDDERAAAWVADGDKGGEFPVSTDNFLEIESVESDSTVEVVWVDSEGIEEVLVTREVGAGETATTTTTNETATNETIAGETATNETTTTTTTEMTMPSGNETSSRGRRPTTDAKASIGCDGAFFRPKQITTRAVAREATGM